MSTEELINDNRSEKEIFGKICSQRGIMSWVLGPQAQIKLPLITQPVRFTLLILTAVWFLTIFTATVGLYVGSRSYQITLINASVNALWMRNALAYTIALVDPFSRHRANSLVHSRYFAACLAMTYLGTMGPWLRNSAALFLIPIAPVGDYMYQVFTVLAQVSAQDLVNHAGYVAMWTFWVVLLISGMGGVWVAAMVTSILIIILEHQRIRPQLPDPFMYAQASKVIFLEGAFVAFVLVLFIGLALGIGTLLPRQRWFRRLFFAVTRRSMATLSIGEMLGWLNSVQSLVSIGLWILPLLTNSQVPLPQGDPPGIYGAQWGHIVVPSLDIVITLLLWLLVSYSIRHAARFEARLGSSLTDLHSADLRVRDRQREHEKKKADERERRAPSTLPPQLRSSYQAERYSLPPLAVLSARYLERIDLARRQASILFVAIICVNLLAILAGTFYYYNRTYGHTMFLFDAVCYSASSLIILVAWFKLSSAASPSWRSCSNFRRTQRFVDSLKIPESIFDDTHNRCFCKDCLDLIPWPHRDVLPRGLPAQMASVPKGWARFGLRVDDSITTPHQVWEKWQVSFHGTNSTAVASILSHHQLLVPGDFTLYGEQLKIRAGHIEDQGYIFTTPTVHYASRNYYASPAIHDGGTVRVVFECRQFPTSYQTGPETIGWSQRHNNEPLDPNFFNHELEWFTKRRVAVILTGVLVRFDTGASFERRGDASIAQRTSVDIELNLVSAEPANPDENHVCLD